MSDITLWSFVPFEYITKWQYFKTGLFEDNIRDTEATA